MVYERIDMAERRETIRMMEKAMTTIVDAAAKETLRSRMLVVAVACAALTASSPVLAQSFDRPDASENIADSEILVEDANAAEEMDDLLESVDALPENIDRVKIITNMERIDVVYLTDMIGENAPEEVEQAIADNETRIDQLQKAIEASAIFYNALASRDVNIPDVVSIELDEPNASIYVRGVPPDEGVSLDEVGDAAPTQEPAELEAE